MVLPICVCLLHWALKEHGIRERGGEKGGIERAVAHKLPHELSTHTRFSSPSVCLDGTISLNRAPIRLFLMILHPTAVQTRSRSSWADAEGALLPSPAQHNPWPTLPYDTGMGGGVGSLGRFHGFSPTDHLQTLDHSGRRPLERPLPSLQSAGDPQVCVCVCVCGRS